jgi:hypothetical protein
LNAARRNSRQKLAIEANAPVVAGCADSAAGPFAIDVLCAVMANLGDLLMPTLQYLLPRERCGFTPETLWNSG